jgi:hypothetical protein
MDVSSLSETQYAKLTEAIEQAMISGAAQAIGSLDELKDASLKLGSNASMADVIKEAQPNMAENLLKYRPFEFNDFLTSLETS